MPICRMDCEHLVHRGEEARHKKVNCVNSTNWPEQEVITDPMEKGRIPHGVFRLIMFGHRAWLGEHSLKDMQLELDRQMAGVRDGGRERSGGSCFYEPLRRGERAPRPHPRACPCNSLRRCAATASSSRHVIRTSICRGTLGV